MATKLSLSRSRRQTCGPVTSTQVQNENEKPPDNMSREELLFQRQLEAAIRRSKADYEKSEIPTADDQNEHNETPDTVILSSPEKPVSKSSGLKKLVLEDSESEDCEEIGESDGSEFSPSPKKKPPPVKTKQTPKPTKPAATPQNESKKKIETPSSPVPSTSGIKRPRKPASKKYSESSPSDSDSDDEDFCGLKTKRKQQTKKPVNPPVKKSKVAETKKKTPTDNIRPEVVSNRLTNPAETISKVTEKDSTKTGPVKSSRDTKHPESASGKKLTKSSHVLAQVTTAVNKNVAETPPAAVKKPLVNQVIPKWTPPAMTKAREAVQCNASTPSPRIGLRVGLSRNFKPLKPLHTSFKPPD